MKYADKVLEFSRSGVTSVQIQTSPFSTSENNEVFLGSKADQDFVGNYTPSQFLDDVFSGKLSGIILVKQSKIEKVLYVEEPTFRINPQKILHTQKEVCEYLKKNMATILILRGKVSPPEEDWGENTFYDYR